MRVRAIRWYALLILGKGGSFIKECIVFQKMFIFSETSVLRHRKMT